MNPLTLSWEEQEELVRINKKVKDVRHVDYNKGQGSRSSSPNQGQVIWNELGSFKERLIRDIPGAYTQAFSFGDTMEDDEEFDVLKWAVCGLNYQAQFILLNQIQAVLGNRI